MKGYPLSERWQGGIYGWQSQFTMANPEYLARDREGRPHYGVMEYAYPDVRRYTIRRILSALGRLRLRRGLRLHPLPVQAGRPW